ncbi:MAG: OmpA family protein [Bacteroidota bacterium]|nr:OmpA family protein [Bacteroidota bacterium]
MIFAQKTEFVPYNLGPNINSKYTEINPLISYDGKFLFFNRQNHPENTFGSSNSQDIWFSQLDDNGQWTKAKRINNFLNQSHYNAIFGFFDSGQKALINNWYTNKNKVYSSGFSIVDFKNNNWGNPIKLNIPGFEKISKGLIINATINNAGNVIIIAGSTEYEGTKTQLFISKKTKNNWTSLKRIRINNIRRNSAILSPFISPDNKNLIFTVLENQKHYLYQINDIDSITKRKNSCFLIDSGGSYSGFQSFFKTNAGGDMGYFCSKKASYGGNDIFGVKIIETRPFVEISGTIFNFHNKLPFDSTMRLKILINNEISDSVKIDKATSKYFVRLPLGKKYQISVKADNFTTINFDTNLIIQKEFIAFQKDFYLQSIPFVKVKLLLFDSTQNIPIPISSKPSIVINGSILDSLPKSDSSTFFNLLLSRNQTYNLKFNAFGYESSLKKLVLDTINEFKEISVSLNGFPKVISKQNSNGKIELIEESPLITIVGNIIDKKTNQPLKINNRISLYVNDFEYPNAVNVIDASFVIVLPFETIYSIKAETQNYYAISRIVKMDSKIKKIKTDILVTPIEVGLSVELKNIFFETGKEILKPESFKELDQVILFLQKSPQIKINIDGHTDNQGSGEKNAHLSWLRAKSVQTYLIEKGNLNARQVSFVGYGSSKPKASNKTAEGRALNRRVEFTITEIK